MLRARALIAAGRTCFEVNKAEETADCPWSWVNPFLTSLKGNFESHGTLAYTIDLNY